MESGESSLWTGLAAPVQAGMGVGYLLESGSSVFVTAAAGLLRRYTPAKDIHDGFPLTGNNEEPNE